MELLVVAAVLVVVLLAVTALGVRRRRRGGPGQLPHDSRREQERLLGGDARGAVNRSSWMLGGSGGGA